MSSPLGIQGSRELSFLPPETTVGANATPAPGQWQAAGNAARYQPRPTDTFADFQSIVMERYGLANRDDFELAMLQNAALRTALGQFDHGELTTFPKGIGVDATPAPAQAEPADRRPELARPRRGGVGIRRTLKQKPPAVPIPAAIPIAVATPVVVAPPVLAPTPQSTRQPIGIPEPPPPNVPPPIDTAALGQDVGKMILNGQDSEAGARIRGLIDAGQYEAAGEVIAHALAHVKSKGGDNDVDDMLRGLKDQLGNAQVAAGIVSVPRGAELVKDALLTGGWFNVGVTDADAEAYLAFAGAYLKAQPNGPEAAAIRKQAQAALGEFSDDKKLGVLKDIADAGNVALTAELMLGLKVDSDAARADYVKLSTDVSSQLVHGGNPDPVLVRDLRQARNTVLADLAADGESGARRAAQTLKEIAQTDPMLAGVLTQQVIVTIQNDWDSDAFMVAVLKEQGLGANAQFVNGLLLTNKEKTLAAVGHALLDGNVTAVEQATFVGLAATAFEHGPAETKQIVADRLLAELKDGVGIFAGDNFSMRIREHFGDNTWELVARRPELGVRMEKELDSGFTWSNEYNAIHQLQFVRFASRPEWQGKPIEDIVTAFSTRFEDARDTIIGLETERKLQPLLDGIAAAAPRGVAPRDDDDAPATPKRRLQVRVSVSS